MDRHSFSFVDSALLTLTKIGNCPNELFYITEMRNLILFQIPVADYSYLNYKFHHRFRLDKRKTLLYHMCLHYAFSNVLKYHFPVHNFEPFRHWWIETINNTGYPLKQNEGEETVNTEHFLVAKAIFYDKISFAEDWTNSDWGIVVAEMLCIIETCCSNYYLNPMREFTWRRLYSPNSTLFSCDSNDFAFYAREQRLQQVPVKILKEITKRQIGGSFKLKEVLKTIASPYYYIFPHQDENEHSDFETNTVPSFEQQLSHRFFTQCHIAVKRNVQGV
ncbi:uncharacterized protein TNCT_55811 [Trichonephila clavata]|uniref:Uncharacterized protein n=1 Tax=Trichonephila clavata TaxID=2740835 RepID=A0A8X6FYI8_TRICU|nr:uncharacterized protein TNCT_55811 [Trichonephila clavata]